MFEVKLTIEAPGLTQALNRLADAWSSRMCAPAPAVPELEAPKPADPAPVSAPHPVSAVAVVPTAPVSPVPAAVPVAPAPSFTLEQIGKAGADLIAANPAKMTELVALLKQYGVDAITQLKPEHIGSFATALRGMGARL